MQELKKLNRELCKFDGIDPLTVARTKANSDGNTDYIFKELTKDSDEQVNLGRALLDSQLMFQLP